jgi:hypothetical protein
MGRVGDTGKTLQWEHVWVGYAIDETPTAMALQADRLYVGNAYAVNRIEQPPYGKVR